MRNTTDVSFILSSLKHYSIVLLLTGMGLIVASGIPLAQTVAVSADSTRLEPLALSWDGRAATLSLAETVTLVPLILVETPPGAGSAPSAALRYSLSITGASGRTLLREDGEAATLAATGVSGAGSSAALELRFPALELPAGPSSVRFEAGPPGMIDSVELRLLASGPGVIPGLITTLTLAILGWLAASLGALQWIRAEAARPPGNGGEMAPHTERVRLWAVGCHLSALLGYVLPFGHLIGPSAIWFTKRGISPEIDRAGRDALNFQLSVTLYVLVGLFLSFFLIGLVVLFLVIVFHFTMVLVAALRAQRGVAVNYPLTMRFI